MNLPLISSDCETNMKMIDYCNKNDDDRCIKQHEKLYLFAKSSVIPYYCWYTPCKIDETFETFELIEEQKLCKMNLCEISLNDIYVTDGVIKVENDCSSTINPQTEICQVVISTNNIDIPNMFKSFLIPVSFFISILLWDGIEIKFNDI